MKKSAVKSGVDIGMALALILGVGYATHWLTQLNRKNSVSAVDQNPSGNPVAGSIDPSKDQSNAKTFAEDEQDGSAAQNQGGEGKDLPKMKELEHHYRNFGEKELETELQKSTDQVNEANFYAKANADQLKTTESNSLRVEIRRQAVLSYLLTKLKVERLKESIR